MTYVQGFIIPVPKAKKEAYIKVATASGPIFQEYGAVRILESWSEDTPDGKVTDYKMAVKAEADEAVVFSWIEWPDKTTCDAATEKMEKDPRWARCLLMASGLSMRDLILSLRLGNKKPASMSGFSEYLLRYQERHPHGPALQADRSAVAWMLIPNLREFCFKLWKCLK